MKKDLITIDTRLTEIRYSKLKEYMERNVLSPDGTLCCRHFENCNRSIDKSLGFYGGQMSHLGRHYDLNIGRKPARIMVVGQEYGNSHSPCMLEERRTCILDTGMDRRFKAGDGHENRNPHMRGTTAALRILLGKGLGQSHEDEFLTSSEGERFHIFDAFALVNALLCSAVNPDAKEDSGKRIRSGKSSSRMQRLCTTHHFQATIKILEPTIVILQGIDVRRWLNHLLRIKKKINDYLEIAYIANLSVILCSFSHPSARAPKRWGNVEPTDYLKEIVEPTLNQAARML